MVEAREFTCFPRWCASPLLPEVTLLGKVMRPPTRQPCDVFLNGGVTTQPSVEWHCPAWTAMRSLVARGGGCLSRITPTSPTSLRPPPPRPP